MPNTDPGDRDGRLRDWTAGDNRSPHVDRYPVDVQSLSTYLNELQEEENVGEHPVLQQLEQRLDDADAVVPHELWVDAVTATPGHSRTANIGVEFNGTGSEVFEYEAKSLRDLYNEVAQTTGQEEDPENVRGLLLNTLRPSTSYPVALVGSTPVKGLPMEYDDSPLHFKEGAVWIGPEDQVDLITTPYEEEEIHVDPVPDVSIQETDDHYEITVDLSNRDITKTPYGLEQQNGNYASGLGDTFVIDDMETDERLVEEQLDQPVYFSETGVREGNNDVFTYQLEKHLSEGTSIPHNENTTRPSGGYSTPSRPQGEYIR